MLLTKLYISTATTRSVYEKKLMKLRSGENLVEKPGVARNRYSK
jgi:hypothetical protein